MKKTLLSLLFSLLIPVFCLAQNPVRYQYYAGDTLNGFDLAKTYTDVLLFSQQHHLTLKEQNNLMYAKEKTFVRLKYHLPLPKQEKAGHLVMRVNPSLLSTCNNVDFETGDYTGWTGAYGYNSNSSSPLAILSPTISTLGTNSPEGSCAYHTIVTSAIGNDPYGLFPQLDPSGGNDAERLGGESINQYGGSDYTGTYSCSGGAYDGTNLCSGGEYIQQSFPVTTSNAMFSYSYAVVLHDGGHSTGEQPYFRVEVLDNLGNPLPCLQYYQECNNGTPPPGYSTSSLNSSVFYLPWKSNTLNLKPYIGTNVTVRFTAAGCIYGGHFGYAYIDATCGPLQLIATTPPSCPPAAPSATFTAPNGGVTYTWAKVPPGAGIVGSTTGQSVTINQNGTYQVTVTTGGGCSYIMDTTISFPVSPSLTVTETNVTCNGLSNGTAGVTATLGTAPYTYSWSPSGGTSSTISGLSTGTYTVTVTTASGCSAKTTTTVAQPAVITASTAQVNVSCSGGSNGSATITPAGGTPAYTYSWSPAGGSGATATGLAAGTYSCTITDIHGCTKTTSVTITQPAGTTITTTQTNVSCNSGTDGTGGVTVTGGTAPYTYSWSPAGGSGSTASGLSAGIYTCYVTDAGGCTNSGTVVISQPAALAFTTSQINEPCDGSLSGSATVNASGGTAPYTYSWSPAGGVASTSSILGAGTYTCTIKDHNGCTTPAVITLTQPAALAVTTSGIAASCNSGANGSATITASGGTPGYSYSWSPSGGSSAIASGLIAGTYTCMVTDNHGCNTSGTVTISQPAALAAPVSSLPSTCGSSNGSASVSVSGGTPPYNYSWTPSGGTGASAGSLIAGTYTCVIKDINLCRINAVVPVTNLSGPSVSLASVNNVTCFGSCNGSAAVTASGGTGTLTYSWHPVASATNTLSALCIGTYTCTVTDANNCPSSVTATVTQPAALSASIINPENVSCFGGNNGSAGVLATGGTAPYTYSWSPGGATGAAANGLSAGLYSVAITDHNGCTQTTSVAITQPAALSISAAGVAASCHGSCNGVLICIPTGGTSPYNYSWNTGCTTPSCNGVCAGSYSVSVTDSHGCSSSDTTTIKQPTAIRLTMFSVPAHCFLADGTDSVSASGGIAPYTYSWSGSGVTGSSDPHVTPGSYVVSVHDANNCPAKDSMIVGNTPGAQAKIIATQNVTCHGGSNGSALAGGTGGTSPYSYSWSTGSVTATASNLNAGIHYVVLTDGLGCTSKDSALILQPTAVVAIPMTAVTLCIGQCIPLTGSASGGTPGYTYTWTLNTLPAVSPACPVTTTSYTVTATDANGCVSPPALATIIVNPPLLVVTSGDTGLCPGQSAMLYAHASGGNGSYSYSWSTAIGLSSTTVQNPIASPATTTTYTVVVTDGCGTPPSRTTDTVKIYPAPVVVFTATDTAGCAPLCTTFTGIASPACASAVWIFGDGTTGSGCSNVSHCYSNAGIYSVTETITDIHGCPASFTRPNYIDTWPKPKAAFILGPQPTTILNSEIIFSDRSIGANSWKWNFGDFQEATSTLENPRHTYTDTGCYTSIQIVENSYGCKDTAYGPLCIHPDFSFYVPNAFTPNGDGKNDLWFPKGLGVDPNNYHMTVYDRWGNQIWETNTWDQGWDGRANGGEQTAQIDVFVWICTVADYLGNVHQLEGHCSIIK